MNAANADEIRVVMVLPTYLPESFGGAEQQARKLALALQHHGVAVTLVAPRLRRETPARDIDGPLSVVRLRVRHAPNLGGRHVLSFLNWCIKLAWWLARRRHDYDLVHIIHGRLHAVPAVLMARILGKPALVKIGRGGQGHFDLDLLQAKRAVGKWYARTVARWATAYVANSREIVADLNRWGVSSARVHQIPNGVDLPETSASQKTPPLKCVYHGRLDREKAIDVMIRGFASVRDTAATLKLVGDGDCRQQLQELTAELRLGDCISFTGPLHDVRPTLLASDLYVSTSLSEGMSNALLEAMSCGLVPVVSAVSGVRDMVDDAQTGLLFAANDPAAFAAKLREALLLPQEARREIGERARASVAGRFGIDEIAHRHSELYAQLVAPSARSRL